MVAEHTTSPHYDAPEQSEKGTKKPGQKKKVKSVPEMLNEENAKPELGKE
jgi:hypothetical protein